MQQLQMQQRSSDILTYMLSKAASQPMPTEYRAGLQVPALDKTGVRHPVASLQRLQAQAERSKRESR